MRTFRKICAIVYLLAAIVALGGFAASVFSPYAAELQHELANSLALRVFVAACLCIAAAGALALVLALLLQKSAPESLRVNGNGSIEVSLGAIKSCVKACLATEQDLMVEHVSVRLDGADHAAARVRVDAIALVEEDLAALAERVQNRVQTACKTLIGSEGVAVKVRFLPSKTTTHTREVSGE